MPSGIEPGILFKVGGSMGVPPTGTKALIVDTDGSFKSMDSAGAKASIGGSGNVASTALARAQALLGATIVKAFGTDFDTNNWVTATLGGSGTANLSTTQRGGVVECKSNGTAGWTSKIVSAGSAGLVINLTTELWYMRTRAKIATTIDASAFVAASMYSTNNTAGIVFGGVGSESTANFAYQIYNNAAALTTAHGSLGVALDQNFHVFETWGDTVNFYIAIDGVTVLTVAIPATTTAASTFRADAQNGGTAANREIDVDDVVICTAG